MSILADATTLQYLITLAVAAIGGVGVAMINKKKTAAETSSLITEAAGRLITSYETRIGKLEAELATTQASLATVRAAETECKVRLARLERIVDSTTRPTTARTRKEDPR